MLQVQDHQALVYTVAKKFALKIGQSVEDLTQEGLLHLCKVAHNYDESKGKPSTFIVMVLTRYYISQIRKANRRKRKAKAVGISDIAYMEPSTELTGDAQAALAMVEKLTSARGRKVLMMRSLQKQGWDSARIEETFQEIKSSIGARRKVRAYTV